MNAAWSQPVGKQEQPPNPSRQPTGRWSWEDGAQLRLTQAARRCSGGLTAPRSSVGCRGAQRSIRWRVTMPATDVPRRPAVDVGPQDDAVDGRITRHHTIRECCDRGVSDCAGNRTHARSCRTPHSRWSGRHQARAGHAQLEEPWTLDPPTFNVTGPSHERTETLGWRGPVFPSAGSDRPAKPLRPIAQLGNLGSNLTSPFRLGSEPRHPA